MAAVCGKRNRFNFPIVYSQIFLLAKRADFFFFFFCRGPFAPFAFVSSAPLAGTPLTANINGCGEDVGHQAARSHTMWLRSPLHFVPFPHSEGNPGQTDIAPELPQHRNHLLNLVGTHAQHHGIWQCPQQKPRLPAMVLGRNRDCKIKESPRVTAVGKETLVQMSLIICKRQSNGIIRPYRGAEQSRALPGDMEKDDGQAPLTKATQPRAPQGGWDLTSHTAQPLHQTLVCPYEGSPNF